MFSDKAISKKDDDELGRYKFAEQIATGLVKTASKRTDGLVIGITGAWGTGKSTLVNFIINEVEKLHEESDNLHLPVILRFNPWMFSGQKELQLIFLTELYSLFRSFDTKLSEVSEKLQKFLGKLHFLKFVHPSAKEITEGISKFLENFKSDSSLEELKKEVDKILIDTETKVYITIDDIDRLTPQEIAEIFQLVKLNGNFANTTFILSYDDLVVQNSMESVFGSFGRNYLEKIVQVDYSVPLLSSERKETILKKRFRETFEKKTIQKYGSLRENISEQPYFELVKSIRDVNRLLNSIQLRLPLLENEVYIPDFILIEGFRVFCPKGFKFMYTSKSSLFELSTSKSKSGIDYIKAKNKLTEFINSAEIEKVAKRVLKDLFIPKGDHQLQVEFSNEKHLKTRRVIHKYYFDRYFSLEIGEREISETQFLQFESTSRSVRHRILKEVVQKEQLVLFLKFLIVKLNFNEVEKSRLFGDLYSFARKVDFHDHNIFASNHDFWFILQFSSDILAKIQNFEIRQATVLNFLNEQRRQAQFYILPLCNDILSAFAKFQQKELYSNDRWHVLFSNEESNDEFITNLKKPFFRELKRNMRRLIKDFEKYNEDEVNTIIVNNSFYLPEYYEKSIADIIKNDNQMLDLITICIGKKAMSSGTVSGFCLEKNGLYKGMDDKDVFERISAINNLEDLDENRQKSAQFFLKVYEDGFPEETYYDYETLVVVSRR